MPAVSTARPGDASYVSLKYLEALCADIIEMPCPVCNCELTGVTRHAAYTRHAAPKGTRLADSTTAGLVREKHYTPAEVAAQWGKDQKTIRRMFEHEPGVLIDEHPETRNKRRYRSFSIPESVLQRVHARMRVGG